MPRTRNGKPVGSTPKKKTAAKTRTGKAPAAAKTRTGKPPADPPPQWKRGANGKLQFTMVERVRIAERVAAARGRLRPEPWAAIAKREAIPERTLQHILMRYEEDMRTLGDGSGLPILSESLLLYTASIEKLAYEAEHGETGAVRIGAIRSMLDALKGRIELLSMLGRMPRSFRAVDELAALQRFTRRLAEIVERHQMPADVVSEFIALADEMQPIVEGKTVPALSRAS